MTKTEIKTIAKDYKALDKLRGMVIELRKQTSKIEYMENQDITNIISQLDIALIVLRDEYGVIISDMKEEEKNQLFEKTKILNNLYK